MESLLVLRHISKTFPGVKALSDVSLTIGKGEIHGLAGENGAGKSTLIKILTGVYTPDAGAEIEIEGQLASIKTPMDAAKYGISVIYQDFSLFGNMTVAENILFGYNRMHGKRLVNWKKLRRRAQQVLGELGIDIPVDESVETLSVGKQQMVAIAKALVFDSKLLIMDEPTSTLSGGEVKQLFTIMNKLRRSGVSILFVTHKLDEMMQMADRISVFRDGQFVACSETAALSKDELVRRMVGREVLFTRQQGRELGEVLLSVEHLSKRGNYRDVSFTLRRGEILGITGLVGAGRSEVLLSLFGVLRPDSGKILLRGKEASFDSTAAAERQGIALIPENRLTEGAFLDKTVRENITVCSLGALRGGLGLLDLRRERQTALEYAKSMDVRPLNLETNVRNLSGGNMQKVVIARWLLRDPDILLIDEPTNGIDIGAKTEIHNLLLRLADQGKSIIVVSSEMLEIMSLADNVLVMSKGRITQTLSGGAITQEAMLHAALQ